MTHSTGIRLTAGVIFFAAVLYGLWYFNSGLSSFLERGNTLPVRALRIDGDLTHVTKRQVADLVGHIAGGHNIASVDTAQIREALLDNPWIARVAVHRKMPDTLEVSLVEHVPAAFWNNDGLYDAQNKEIFKPNLANFAEPLVRLGAYRDNLAPEVYESAVAFIRILQKSKYHMVALYLDQVRCYTITLSGGTKLILGRGREICEQRLERLLKSLPLTDIKLVDVSYVDLRYDVGFAVGPMKNTQEGERKNDDSVPQE